MDTAAAAQYFQPVQANTSHPGVIEHSRRQHLAEQVHTLASDTTKAVASVRAFDRTGNITDSLGHLVACAERTLRAAKALAADVERLNPPAATADPNNQPIIVTITGPEPPTPKDLAAVAQQTTRVMHRAGVR